MITDPALIVIDLQNNYCKPEYAITAENSVDHVQSAIEQASKFNDAYRSSGRTPIFVRTHHDERSNSAAWNSMYEERSYSSLCQPGTQGAEFVPELDRVDSDPVVTKNRYSGFHNTPLETYLSANDIQHVLVCGVSTNVCVESTVRDAYNRDYVVTILADCTAASRPEVQEQALERLDQYFGTVRTAADVKLDLENVSDSQIRTQENHP